MQVIRLNRTSVPNHFTTMPHSESQSDAEWIALDALVQMLEDRLGHSIVRSECVPRQDDPLDFRLTIEGIEYGVEVTIVSDGDNRQYAWFDEFITQLRIQVDQKNYQLGRVNVTLNQRPKMASKATFDLKVALNVSGRLKGASWTRKSRLISIRGISLPSSRNRRCQTGSQWTKHRELRSFLPPG